MKLLAVGTNAKTIKGDKASEYLTAILYMAPHKGNTKGVNLCPKASQGCTAACLNTAGRGKLNSVQKARIAKADYFVSDREAFLEQLHRELLDFSRYARLRGKKPAVRLNGTTDILWERYLDMGLYPEIQFYDYTKWSWKERIKAIRTPNYHLTFSRSEDTTDSQMIDYTNRLNEMNIAVVFADKALPESYLGFPVIDGDKTDLRFLDPTGVIVGLTAKGDAKKDTSGFVIHREDL